MSIKDNTEELKRKLESIIKATENEVESAILAGALMVQSDAKRNSPVDTGLLRNSITTGDIDNQGDIISIEIGTNVEYAEKVHENHKEKSKYLSNALDKNRARIMRRIEQAIQRGTK